MKKLFFLSAFFFAVISLKAQFSYTLNVYNYTNCDVYLEFIGHPSSCTLTSALTSGVYVIPPTPSGTPIVYSANTVFGFSLPTTAQFVAANIYSTGNTSCSNFYTTPIGDPCIAVPNASAMFTTFDLTCTNNCHSLPTVQATWVNIAAGVSDLTIQ